MLRNRVAADRRSWLETARAFAIACLAAGAPAAQASIFKGEALDKAADVLTVVILIFVPLLAITVFWLVHILPEKVAEQREHPQKEVIKVICLLSLVFGGLLWPIAWIMAYSKPVLYKMAYGKDKHDDFYKSLGEEDAAILSDDVARLRTELDSLAKRGQLPVELREMHARLTAVQGQVGAPPASAGEGAG
jgi:CBS domain containing-hemolysin-like protein